MSLFPYLKKAYDIDPNRLDAYSDLAAYYEAARDTSNLKMIIQKWYNYNDFSSGLLSFNYNVLKPLDKNAILIVNGDNIYFPLKVLQYSMGIRCDVKIILASFLYIDSYTESICKELNIEPFKKDSKGFQDSKIFFQDIISYLTQKIKDRPIYLSDAMLEYFYEKIKDNLYNEGLAFKYSREKYDNIAVLKRNYEKIFLKDYLSYDFTNDVSESIVNYTSLNYIPSFLTLYEHYKTSGDNDKANEIKEQMYNIAKKSDYKDYGKYLKEKLGDK